VSQTISTTCCVVGGGPAGLMAGFLLARGGVDTVVLEKHADFLRDFRGDTIHPSTLQVMGELGLLDRFLRLPHRKAFQIAASLGDRNFVIADFRHLPTTCKFVAFMPQWDFLDFIAGEAKKLPNFRLMMETAASGLIEEDGRIVGVRAQAPDGEIDIRATLAIAADGRASTIRAAAGLEVEDFGAPMDVLWFKMRREQGDPDETFGRVAPGRMVAMIERGAYWQCGYVIPKGGAHSLRSQPIAAFRDAVASAVPFLEDRVDELRGWEDVNLLTVQVDRLTQWSRPGLLCIGDAAHAMSPVGGVGVNLAIQDAVATANLLSAKLRGGTLADSDLAAVQKRREFPARLTQRIQLLIQNRVIRSVLSADRPFEPPLALKLFDLFPALRRLPARLIGLGVRPEHVESGAVSSSRG
jgi:2-polyprenyl-6-methoxyphenol hydroxylase-like FAD-dependent oxidoreductase